MLAICFAIVVFLVATWAIHFTAAGMYTAIIPLVVRVSKPAKYSPRQVAEMCREVQGSTTPPHHTYDFCPFGTFRRVSPATTLTQFVDGLLGLCAATHFTRPERPKARIQVKAITIAEPPSPTTSSSSFRARGRRSWQRLLKILASPCAAASEGNKSLSLNSRSGAGGRATATAATYKVSVSGTVVVPTMTDSAP